MLHRFQNPLQRYLIGLGLLTCLALPLSAATDAPVVLGTQGELMRLETGTYGDLFPTGTAAEPTTRVLALDVVAPDGSVDRYLVPGTETQDIETSATLMFEDSSGVTYLLWERLYNNIHPILSLIGFEAGTWTTPIVMQGNPFARKGAPQIEVTREHAKGSADDDEQTDVTILNVTWWEETSGLYRKRYAPIVLQDGHYIGWEPEYELPGFFADPNNGAVPSIDPWLEEALTLLPGRNGRTVVVAFLNPQTHRVATLDVELLPQALSRLVEKARLEIIAIGFKANSRDEFANDVYDAILELGTDFHDSILAYMAEQLHGLIVATPTEELLSPEGIGEIVEKARLEIIAIGSKIGSAGVQHVGDSTIIGIGKNADDETADHLLKVTTISDRKAPTVGGPATLYASANGKHTLCAWEEDDRIFFVESEGDGWRDAQSIVLTPQIDKTTAYRMLQERIRNR